MVDHHAQRNAGCLRPGRTAAAPASRGHRLASLPSQKDRPCYHFDRSALGTDRENGVIRGEIAGRGVRYTGSSATEHGCGDPFSLTVECGPTRFEPSSNRYRKDERIDVAFFSRPSARQTGFAHPHLEPRIGRDRLERRVLLHLREFDGPVLVRALERREGLLFLTERVVDQREAEPRNVSQSSRSSAQTREQPRCCAALNSSQIGGVEHA